MIQTKIGVDIVKEKIKVVELTLEDGSKMLCRAGEGAVLRLWDLYPVVSTKQTGEEQEICGIVLCPEHKLSK